MRFPSSLGMEELTLENGGVVVKQAPRDILRGRNKTLAHILSNNPKVVEQAG